MEDSHVDRDVDAGVGLDVVIGGAVSDHGAVSSLDVVIGGAVRDHGAVSSLDVVIGGAVRDHGAVGVSRMSNRRRGAL